MNDETKPTEKKRGRPKKVEAAPVVNECEERIEMQDSSNKPAPVTLATIQRDLTQAYANLLNKENAGSVGINLNMYNPFLQRSRLSQLNTKPNTISREDLTKFLQQPDTGEAGLRAQGWSLSSTQYMYYKILRLACDVPMFKWYVTPEFLSEKEYGSKKFKEDDDFVNDWLTKFDPVNTLKKVSMEVKREGKASYLLRNSVMKTPDGKKKTCYATWQKLPTDYIKPVRIGEHGFIVSFNMMIFLNPAFSPEQYPPFIGEIWEDIIRNDGVMTDNVGDRVPNIGALMNYSYNYNGVESRETIRGNLEVSADAKTGEKRYFFWVQLPQELCYTFSSDSSTPWMVPDTAGLLLSLDELADYDTLQGLVESTPLTAILTAEADVVNNAVPGQNQTVLDPETIVGLQDKFNESTSTNVEAFFGPLRNFKLLSLPSQPNSSDISANATRNVVTRAGLGGVMVTSDKPSVSQVKASQMLLESEVDYVTRQFESVLNMIINNLIGCEYKWRLHLWGGIFTFADEIKRDKELFVSGGTFILPKLLSAYGMTVKDAKSVDLYVKSLSVYDDFQTVTQASQAQEAQEEAKKSGQNNGAGRPAKDDGDIDNDNTAASKDGGLDTADVREFAETGKCIICHNDSDTPICEECTEKYITDEEE